MGKEKELMKRAKESITLGAVSQVGLGANKTTKRDSYERKL